MTDLHEAICQARASYEAAGGPQATEGRSPGSIQGWPGQSSGLMHVQRYAQLAPGVAHARSVFRKWALCP